MVPRPFLQFQLGRLSDAIGLYSTFLRCAKRNGRSIDTIKGVLYVKRKQDQLESRSLMMQD